MTWFQFQRDRLILVGQNLNPIKGLSSLSFLVAVPLSHLSHQFTSFRRMRMKLGFNFAKVRKSSFGANEAAKLIAFKKSLALVRPL